MCQRGHEVYKISDAAQWTAFIPENVCILYQKLKKKSQINFQLVGRSSLWERKQTPPCFPDELFSKNWDTGLRNDHEQLLQVDYKTPKVKFGFSVIQVI